MKNIFKSTSTVEDVFKPRHEPARTIYDAFQDEAEKRDGRHYLVWREKECLAVLNAACDYAEKHGLIKPTLEEVQSAEMSASGHVDYGAKWAYGIRDVMERVEQ